MNVRAVNMVTLWKEKIYVPYFLAFHRKNVIFYGPLNKSYLSVFDVLKNPDWRIDRKLGVDIEFVPIYEGDIILANGKKYEVEYDESALRVIGKNGKDIVEGEVLALGAVVDNIYLRRLRTVEEISQYIGG